MIDQDWYNSLMDQDEIGVKKRIALYDYACHFIDSMNV